MIRKTRLMRAATLRQPLRTQTRCYTTPPPPEDDNEELAAELTELHTEVEDLQTELAQCGQQAETLRRQRMRLEERLAVAREEAADLKGAGNGDGL